MKKIVQTMILPLNTDAQVNTFNCKVIKITSDPNKAILSMQYSTTTEKLPHDLPNLEVEDYYTNGSVIGMATKDTDGLVRHTPFAIHSHFVMIVWSEIIEDEELEDKNA